jgi:hypothetical protein
MYDKEGLAVPTSTLPPQEPSPVLEELGWYQGLSEHVCWLFIISNVVEAVVGTFILRVMQELEIVGIDVLGARASLGELGNGKNTTVVNEACAANGRTARENRESQLPHLSEDAQNWDDSAISSG